MLENLKQLIPAYEPWQIIVELLAIWCCVYFVFRFLRGTRGAGIIKGFAVILVIATLGIRVLSLGTDAFARLGFLYDRFLSLIAILLIIVFQPELRHAMIRLGHAWSFRSQKGSMERLVDAVHDAVAFLSKSQFGALIAIERKGQLGGLIETGVLLDAKVNARLLESIFWPNSPLHDLGVVIRGERILAASVQFPLAEEGALSPKFGSRHRAAVGLSLETDCVVVIVSEENGAISIAQYGELDYDIARDAFRETLSQHLAVERRGGAARHELEKAGDVQTPASTESSSSQPDGGDPPDGDDAQQAA